MPIIEVKHLSKSFESRSILKDISFDVAESEICAIIGKSGSGKTTLIRIMSGLLLPDNGEVIFQGDPIEGPDVRLVPGYEEIRIVHQDFQLKHKMTVRENVRYELLAYAKSYQDERIQELLDLCKISHLSGKDISLLSGGEKQRVAIARAMATEPEVLVLDEPFSNLDINTKSLLLSELKLIAKTTNTAIILITHDARDAMEIADRIVVLNKGGIVNDGSPQEVYRNPQHTDTANLLGLFNKVDSTLVKELLGTKELNAIWAEDILLNEGDNVASVVDVIFAGGFNKIKLDYQKHTFWAYDPLKSINIGDEIQFHIRSQNAFALKD
ncbi:MAG: ABC transporter ATP-binding protein [Cyclobacteriaceae bacterium]